LLAFTCPIRFASYTASEPRVKRIALLLVFVAACKTVVVHEPANGMTGGESPRAAVDRFIAGARAQDLQAIGAVFGNDKGPMRDQTDRAVAERQLLIQLQCLRHDKATISGPVRGEGGRQIFVVDFTQGTNTASVHFTTVRGPSDRWYVEIFEIVVLQNRGFCSKTGG
jgi:hypothetical protein